MGVFAATMMRNSIKQAHAAMIAGDVIAMLTSLEDLREYRA